MIIYFNQKIFKYFLMNYASKLQNARNVLFIFSFLLLHRINYAENYLGVELLEEKTACDTKHFREHLLHQ